MASGVIMSCIATLGPVFFRERQVNSKAAFQDWSNKAKSGSRPPFGDSTSRVVSKHRIFDGTGLTKISSDHTKLMDAAEGMGHHVSVDRPLTSSNASREANPKDIVVKKGYTVSMK